MCRIFGSAVRNDLLYVGRNRKRLHSPPFRAEPSAKRHRARKFHRASGSPRTGGIVDKMRMARRPHSGDKRRHHNERGGTVKTHRRHRPRLRHGGQQRNGRDSADQRHSGCACKSGGKQTKSETARRLRSGCRKNSARSFACRDFERGFQRPQNRRPQGYRHTLPCRHDRIFFPRRRTGKKYTKRNGKRIRSSRICALSRTLLHFEYKRKSARAF